MLSLTLRPNKAWPRFNAVSETNGARSPYAEFMKDVAAVRKFLPQIYAVFLVTAVLCYITSFGGFFEQWNGLARKAPVVRFTTFSVLTVFLAAIVALLTITLSAKAVPCNERLTGALMRVLNVLAFVSFGVMVVFALASAPLQRHYLPQLGYSTCNALKGNPSVWFTDWVRNPDWCVKGKSLEWVNEQAGATAPPGTP